MVKPHLNIRAKENLDIDIHVQQLVKLYRMKTVFYKRKLKKQPLLLLKDNLVLKAWEKAT